MNSFLVHISPTKGARAKSVPLEQINETGFDFKNHFKQDLLTARDHWWAVAKLEPWSTIDCMIVDSGEKIRSSFSSFSLREISTLFETAKQLTKLAENEGAQRIIVGANINYEKNNLHLDKVLLRLHLHIVGFLEKELDAMESVSIENLKNKQEDILNYLYDPLLEKFKKAIVGGFPREAHDAELGVKFNFKGGFDKLGEESFCAFVINLDRKIYELFPYLSYSFCLEKSEDDLILTVSPRSVFGKGVLEAIGIILKRDKEKTISKENFQFRDDFFKKIKEKI